MLLVDPMSLDAPHRRKALPPVTKPKLTIKPFAVKPKPPEEFEVQVRVCCLMVMAMWLLLLLLFRLLLRCCY